MKSKKEVNELFLRYLGEVKGLDVKGEKKAMIYKIKFKRLGLKYIAEVANVFKKAEAVKKLKDYTGDDIKIISVKLFDEWQRIKIA